MSKIPIDPPVLDCPWKKAAPKPAAPPAKGKKGKKAEAKPPEEKVNKVEPPPEPKAQAPAPPPPEQKIPEIEIVDNGSNIPLPYKPITPMELLGSSNPHVLKVMLRQLRDMQGPQPDTSNGVLKVMGDLADGFKRGSDVTAHMPEVAIHLTGRSERRELLGELTEVLDDERVIEMFRSRAKFEDFLHSCQRRSDLTIAEGIAIQAYFNNELDKVFSRRVKRSTADVSTGREPAELVSRANLPTQLHRKELQTKFDEATPQEREILRKIGFTIQQNLIAARLTRTTTTETVEIVDGGPAPVPEPGKPVQP